MTTIHAAIGTRAELLKSLPGVPSEQIGGKSFELQMGRVRCINAASAQ
jgi:hypothetical protein